MSWPAFSDYQTAIQNPRYCFQDPILKSGHPEPDPRLGLPISNSGNYAVVFPVLCSNQKWAVRCFSRKQTDREHRYDFISEYLNKVKLPWMAHFSYLKQGIRVNSDWFPIIKMEWIEGESLDKYISRNLNNTTTLLTLAASFAEMVQGLHRHNIAHGDLQHRNILINKGQLKLVDYDGLFVPGLGGLPCSEGGHPNYQSPLRTIDDFADYLDNFSSWVIYITLVAIASDPAAWKLNKGNDEALIFEKDDFQYPELSPAFDYFANSSDSRVKQLIFLLKNFAKVGLKEIPPLDTDRIPLTLGRGRIPDWLTDYIPQFSPTQEPWEDKLIIPKPLNLNISLETNSFQTEPIYPAKIHIKTNYTALGVGFWSTIVLATTCSLLSINSDFFSWVIGISAISVECWILGIIIAFGTLPEIKRRKKMRNQLRVIRDRINAAENIRGLLLQKITEINQSEQRYFEGYSVSYRKSSKKAKDAVDKCNFELKNALVKIAEKRKNVTDGISQEMSLQLQRIRLEKLNNQLRQLSIQQANITGIGDHIKGILINSGIRTAGDFTNVTVYKNYYRGTPGEIAYIVLSNGQNVRIPQIGPKKATSLLEWRNRAAIIYQNILPTTLSIEEQQAIRTSAANKLGQLNEEENKLRYDNKRKIEVITKMCKQEHDELKYNVSVVRKQTVKEFQEKRKQLEENFNLISGLKTEISQRSSELESLELLKLTTFFKNILSFRKE